MARGVAQFGSASGLGPEGRRFKSCLPDQFSRLKSRKNLSKAPIRSQMKQWVKKIVDQLDWNSQEAQDSNSKYQTNSDFQINEEIATVLFFIDVLNKNLIEIEGHNLRKTRETLDEIAKSLLSNDKNKIEKSLFRFRQWYSSYRIDEYSYIQKTFDEFKNIIWDFADQLSEDIHLEKSSDREVLANLEQLREAVESNSIHMLKTKSREFIDSYVEIQTKKDQHREKRLDNIQNNLRSVKKQLLHANHTMRTDHLTGAFNRKCFDEQLKKIHQMSKHMQMNASLIMLDIDHFKKVNDCYGHDVGDFVIQECVRCLKEVFKRENDFIARIGGEEFAVLLPDYQVSHAQQKAEEALNHIRSQIIVHKEFQIKFTVSMGIAQLSQNETTENWLKRADQALYDSKRTGRNKWTVSLISQNDSNVA
jgi:diguanylate cyclase